MPVHSVKEALDPNVPYLDNAHNSLNTTDNADYAKGLGASLDE